MVKIQWFLVCSLATLGKMAAFGDETEHCFGSGAPCGFFDNFDGLCEDSRGKLNTTCQCVSGYIPYEQGCLWCQKKWGDSDSLLKLQFDRLAQASAECTKSHIKIAPIPSQILKSMSSYNATNTVDHPKSTKRITDFSDITTATTYHVFTRTIDGGGDHTPTQWLTDTRNPNDVPLQTAQADDARKAGVPLGLAAAAVLGLL